MLDQLIGDDIRAYGTNLGAACRSVSDSSTRLQGVSDAVSAAHWTGPAGNAYRNWHGALQTQTATFAEALNRVASFAPKVAESVEDAQRAKKAEQEAHDAVDKANKAVQAATSALQAARTVVDSANASVAGWIPHGPHPVPPPGPTPGELAAVTAAQHQLTAAEHDLDQERRDLQRATDVFDQAEQHRKSVARAFAVICREEASALGVTLPNPPDPAVVVGDFLTLTGFARAEGRRVLQAIDPKHPIPFNDLVAKVGTLATAAQTPLAGLALARYDRFVHAIADDVRATIPIAPANFESGVAARAQARYWLKDYADGQLKAQGLDEFGAAGEVFGRAAGATGILGDFFTIAHPDFRNPWLAAGERTVAEVNAASTAATLMPELTSTIIGVNEGVDWIPGAAPWIALGSGLVLGGGYLATHWSQTVGWVGRNVAAPYEAPVNDGVKTVEQVGSDLGKGHLVGAGEHLVTGAVKTGLDAADAPLKVAANVGGGLVHDAGSLASDLNPFR